MSAKRFGCCTLCDREVFEALLRWPPGHVNENQIRRPGAPINGARRVTVILVDGSIADLTFCGACKASPENLCAIWKKVVRTMAFEMDPEWRAGIKAAPLEDHERYQTERLLMKMIESPPLGVLHEQPWSEVDGWPN